MIAITFFDFRGVIEIIDPRYSINWFLKDLIKNSRLLFTEMLLIVVAFYLFKQYLHIPIILMVYELWQTFVICADYGAIDELDVLSNYITWFLYGTLWIFVVHFLINIYQEKKWKS